MALTQLEENSVDYWRRVARSNASQAVLETELREHWRRKCQAARRSNQKLAIAAAVFACVAVAAGVALLAVIS